MIITDTHVHVGQWGNAYHSPADVFSSLAQCGVRRCFVSSTSVCRNDAHGISLMLDEMDQCAASTAIEAHAVLRITPYMASSVSLKRLVTDRHWAMLKIHHEDSGWELTPDLDEWIAEAAEELRIPVLIHTGNKEGCHPGSFTALIASHPGVTFILAHGRPLEEAVRVLEAYPNTLVDTAFMPDGDILWLANNGHARRVLFGTDYPINNHFPPLTSGPAYVAERLDAIKALLSPADCAAIMSLNAGRSLATGPSCCKTAFYP